MRKQAVLVLLSLFVGALCTLGCFESSHAQNGPPVRPGGTNKCEQVYIDVKIDPSQTVASDSVFAEVCAISRHNINKPVLVLIHGGSYDHNYWNPSFDNRHSYVDFAIRQGYTVVNIDRVGVGLSSKPAPMALDFDAAAYTIHQIVQLLKGDGIELYSGAVTADEVVLVGFSFGSMIATMEAATYKDVDGLILQAYSHTVGPAGVASYSAAYPALNEPKFNGLDVNYFTTIPGFREELFFYEDGVEPYVLHHDEMVKKTYTLAELMSIDGSMAASYGVEVPVFLIVGDYDMIACEAPSCKIAGSLDNEGTHFPLAPSFEVKIIDNAGHTLNWHKNPTRTFSAMGMWLRKTFR